MMTALFHRAIHRLASCRGHEWATRVTENECAADWDAARRRSTAAMEAEEATCLPPGVGEYQDTSHTTSTGRLSWSAGPNGTLHLAVSRPSLIGGYTVIRGTVAWTDGDDAPASYHLVVDARPVQGAHLRHLVTMELAAYCAMGARLTDEEAVEFVLQRIEEHASGEWDYDTYLDGLRLDTWLPASIVNQQIALALFARVSLEKTNPFPVREAS